MPALSLKSLAGKLGLLIAALAASLILLEAATRLLSDIHPSLALRDPLVGKTHTPGFEGEVFVEEAGRPIHLRFNREGFRGPDVAYQASTGTRRIAVIGDSMVAAVESDEHDTAVAELEQLLNQSDSERRWEVLNFGVAGSSTGQELVLYRELVRRYRPDLVIVVYFMGNDFSDNSRRLSNNPRIYFELDAEGRLVQQPYSVASKKLSVWLNENSRFYVWQKATMKTLRHGLAPRSGDRIFDPEPDQMLAHAWRLNAALLESFREAVFEDGARLVLVLCPAGGQVYDDMWERVLERADEDAHRYDRDYPRGRLGRIAAAAAIPILDLTPSLRAARGAAVAAALAPDQRLYLAGGEGHLSARGNLEVALAVHRFLVEGDGRATFDEVRF